ncbi:MAG TPA: hypothetical protein VGR06_04035 [Actinophytocola sp.]|jgi:hypothetical protein|uniref:hypothetical protein n=1 Tax=Actinophytocola sp. TaxID=1872138 RepID=UPI002E0B5234|nr:hypothetical protein [Actinophytocola sp.]
MCSWCQVVESYCFCGSSMDPDGRTEPCEVRTNPDATCSRCGHSAGPVPMDTSVHGYDYAEYE